MRNKLPFGYYLEKADTLLTAGINHIHHKLNITRSYWQILNAINESSNILRAQIRELLREFASHEEIDEAITNLIGEG